MISTEGERSRVENCVNSLVREGGAFVVKGMVFSGRLDGREEYRELLVLGGECIYSCRTPVEKIFL